MGNRIEVRTLYRVENYHITTTDISENVCNTSNLNFDASVYIQSHFVNYPIIENSCYLHLNYTRISINSSLGLEHVLCMKHSIKYFMV